MEMCDSDRPPLHDHEIAVTTPAVLTTLDRLLLGLSFGQFSPNASQHDFVLVQSGPKKIILTGIKG